VKVVLFGATGMVGQGVLRECLADPEVREVLVIGRAGCGVRDARVREIVRGDLFDLSDVEQEFAGFDVCFFCLGVSSAGMTEESYRRITFDLTVAVAETLSRVAPSLTFVYVSGAGTDSSGEGRTMWARVKGRTENHLLALPFRAAYMFRPAFIQPLHGIRSRTTVYRIIYAILGPLYPLLRRAFPAWVTTTEKVGRAMIAVAKHGHATPIVENDAINAIAEAIEAGGGGRSS
jgi:uncharacterized protein YbjT (DUF2867 family)